LSDRSREFGQKPPTLSIRGYFREFSPAAYKKRRVDFAGIFNDLTKSN